MSGIFQQVMHELEITQYRCIRKISPEKYDKVILFDTEKKLG
jgi:hypothetical protein